MKAKAILTLAIFLPVLALFLGLLFAAVEPGLNYNLKVAAKKTVVQLVTATKAYQEEYGIPPQGDGKSVLLTLQNDNPRKIVFIKLDPREISKEGLLLDPWGMPYVLDLSNATGPRAYSFGKNKIDEGGRDDDVASWK